MKIQNTQTECHIMKQRVDMPRKTKDFQQPPETSKRKKRSSPGAFKENIVLLSP